MKNERMKFETPDLTAENVAKIAETFPGVVTEGKVNFDLLRTLLGDEVHGDEAYEFTWVGKRAAIAEAARPIRKTLRPSVEESKNWDTTENLYIEGDNLDVLKLLQESYLGKVKMIYIDPPYNTGNDFIYRDDFTQSREDYDEEAGVLSDEGRLFKNTETSGRFHSNWCSMMYPRLVLARNLLRSDGVIFISIDDNEVRNLKYICDEIFGEGNFIAQLTWENREGGGSSDSKFFRIKHEYILCYSKDFNYAFIKGLPVEDKDRYRLEDKHVKTRGKHQLIKLDSASLGYIKSLDYPIMGPDGIEIYPNKGKEKISRWRWSKRKLKWGQENDFVVIQRDRNGDWAVYTKQYLNCDNEGNIIKRTIKPIGVIDKYSTTQSNRMMKTLMDGAIFQYSKPYQLMEFLIEISTGKNDTVLDFFSGSATTAHAVIAQNAEVGGNRKFIMVQLPEVTDVRSEAYEAGYKNISDIGKERIRRAGELIKADIESANSQLELGGEPKQIPDIGFRVFKVDDSNMNDIYYTPGEYSQDLLSEMESNIKADRDDMDLLFGCLLDWGLPLSMPHCHEDIDGFTVHTYNKGDLIACFDEEISDKVVREIASRRPLRAIFRDSSFTNSPAKINVFEIFKLLASNTTVRVI